MRIGILDHMGYGNLGDAATQDAVIASITRRISDAQIVGFSLVPEDTTRRHGIPAHCIRAFTPKRTGSDGRLMGGARFDRSIKAMLKKTRIAYALIAPISRLSREALFWLRSYRLVRSLDVLVVSGGGQFDDVWPRQPYTVFVFALLTRLAGKKVFVLNVGVGPLKRSSDRKLTKWACRLAHYRSVRDDDSQRRLREFGVKAETHVYPDLVYSLEVPLSPPPAHSKSGRPVIGINPMGFYDPRIWPKKDHAIYESYLDKLTSFAIWVAKEGYEIRLFTTDPGVDRYALPDLKIRLSTHLSADLVREIKSDSVSRMLKQMAEFNVVVTSKFHGIVFSHLLNKPVISLSYHEKMDCIMRAAGQGRFCTSIETFDRSWLISAFRLLVAESPAIKGYYPAMVARNAAMLSGQLDDLFGIYMPHPQRDLDRSADCPHERTSLSIVSHEKEVPSS